MSETTEQTEGQQTLPTTEPAPAAKANGETPPADPPKVDERDAELAALREANAKHEADAKKREEAKLSEQERNAKRAKELDEREALIDKREAYSAAGLPKSWADGVSPEDIRKYIDKQIKAAGKAAPAAGGGDPVIPPAPDTGNQPPSGNPKDAPFKNLAKELRKKSRGG